MNRSAVLTIAAAVVLAITGLAVPQAADAASHPHCSASASPKHPGDNANVYIAVTSNLNHARAKTVAEYKSTNTTKHAKTNRHGNATLVYDISDASPGYKVKVDVTVTRKDRRASCKTSFTPR